MNRGRLSGWNGWSGERPPWWPQDQQWPPRGSEEWGRRGRRAARWIGCAVGVVLLLVAGAVVGLIYLVLSAIGVVGSAPLGRVPAGLALIVAVLAVILAASALRRVARPATELVAAARRIEAGDYSARVSVRGPRQLRSLARAFNEMSSRLEAEQARRQSVVADVAHELRTPLTVIRGQTEAIIDGLYPGTPERLKPILAATDTLETLIDDLRTLAMSEAGSLQLHREPTDLALLVNDTVDGFRGAAGEQGVTLVADVATPAPVIDADPVRIGSVLRNLLTNALRHTPRDGTVRVSVAVAGSPGDENVRLTVTDDGDGIPDNLLPRVFDRFVKGPGSAGSG
ncbi:MAG: sensor histidine kinase, partial [Candidatus Dormibacteria bacterium]